MSNFEPLPTQPDWREQYPTFPLPGENGLLQASFEQTPSSNASESTQTQQQTSTRPTLEHRHSLGPLRQDPQPAPVIERPDSAPGDIGQGNGDVARNDSLVSSESTALSLGSLGSNPLSSASSAPAQQATVANNEGGRDPPGEIKDEEDEEDDDDEMLDAEEGAPPQTAAERRAERRKMKRFRLTHQQTRFLMSEFAKQAHPDAAHRERLSREIPGLSPRQVQVWFQNRRAKIKRLTADDRERMMKMRAVPDDFDNVQALHSPYGAVHGIGTPMQSPVDFVSGYGDQMMRPLMVDTMRRNDHDDHISPTGLSPAFGHVGFAHGGNMGNADVLSPLSLSSDRYYSGSHLSSPMSAGPRSSNPFDRQSSYQALSHSRQPIRPLQPLQLRETMSRSRSESIQSPLRSSMSWKGETLDYGNYQTGQPSPQLSGRQQSLYQQDQIGNNAVNAHQYDANAFSNNNIQSSPPHMYSPSGPSTSMQQSAPSTLSRLRASSSAFPPGLDLRNQYRALPAQLSSPHGIPATTRSSSFASAFTGGYASAPLTAPRFQYSAIKRAYGPPQDFSSAYNSITSPVRAQQGDRDFGNQNNGDSGGNTQGSQGQGQGQTGDQQQQSQQQHQVRHNEETSYLRTPVEYETGQKRKRSFTMPGSFESP
ncbi:hypothetical protein B0J14DRAFT_612378 [Halenospora varia]|nr:hypothetical protein B0J14DRAFT_612378 [Halenospora varia]